MSIVARSVSLGTLAFFALSSVGQSQAIDPEPDEAVADMVVISSGLGDDDPEEQVEMAGVQQSGGAIDGIDFLFEGIPVITPASLADSLVDPRVRMTLNSGPNGNLVRLELLNPVDPNGMVLVQGSDLTFSNPFDANGQLINEVMSFSAPSVGMTGTFFLEPIVLPAVNNPNTLFAASTTSHSLDNGIAGYLFQFSNVPFPASQIPEPAIIPSLLMLGITGATLSGRRRTKRRRA